MAEKEQKLSITALKKEPALRFYFSILELGEKVKSFFQI